MDITTEAHLKGSEWPEALRLTEPFYAQGTQHNYCIYAICVAIGMMYDRQASKAGEDLPDDMNPPAVPRAVLLSHNNDLDFLFQTAILTTSLVNFSDEERMALAFNQDRDKDFQKLDFLTQFANFGVGVLLRNLSEDPVESMENIKNFLESTMEGSNLDIFSIPDDDLSIEDLK